MGVKNQIDFCFPISINFQLKNAFCAVEKQNFHFLFPRMSALRALVEELEKEELPGNIDPEKDDSETAAVTENNDRRHYEEVSKSKLKVKNNDLLQK